ncbi:hypothetical protein ILUMI_08469 [Ignelater luminosus]|uniref:PiggyBac transposable element-derived protein domain-containing protein n=1 Tax=Ignelater luminosus TaxID=2038154 RepID=A0A8K0GFX3_IGNLU|nr:hypothetical protein ILUMI_08469 [Ignelater luminosus]
MAEYNFDFASNYSEQQALADAYNSDFEIIDNESDGSDAKKDFTEIREDKEGVAGLSNSDNDGNKEEEVWISKDGTMQWSTKKPIRKRVLSRIIVKQAFGIPRHLNLSTPADCFRVFMTNKIIDKICLHTNQRPNEQKDKKPSLKKKGIATGRRGFKVYIPSKPGKYGIQIWMTVDCEALYITNLQIYSGKFGNIKEHQEQVKRVVLDLVTHLNGSSRNITTANFFTSFSLRQQLLKEKLTLTGTARINRNELPSHMLPSKLREKKSFIVAFASDILLASYVPKKGKAVVMMFTQRNKFDVSKDHRKSDGQELLNEKSNNKIAICYIFVLVDFAGINAYVIFSEVNNTYNNTTRRRRFLLEQGEDLVKPQIERRIQNP